MEKDRSTRVIAMVALLIAIVGVSIGFAAMSTQLNISGTAEVNPASWNIKFANLSGPNLTGAATESTAPTINGTSSTNISTFALNLTKPGDSVTYTFDIQNTGTLNAVLDTLTKAVTPTCTDSGTLNDTPAQKDATVVCSNIAYTLKYTSGGATVAQDDTLAAGQSRNVTLKLEYLSSASEVPLDSVSITDLGITLLYVQQ